MSEYFLVAGLGNPSAKYEKTRHNAGFWFVEKLASDAGVEFEFANRCAGLLAKLPCQGRTALVLKPLTYMNCSGRSVGTVARYYRISPADILVAYDDLDFPAGVVRLKMDGGHGGHNGLRDIISSLDTGNFLRLRIGIGRPDDRNQVLSYVLGKPSVEDQRLIELAIERSAALLPEIVSGSIADATNRLHAG